VFADRERLQGDSATAPELVVTGGGIGRVKRTTAVEGPDTGWLALRHGGVQRDRKPWFGGIDLDPSTFAVLPILKRFLKRLLARGLEIARVDDIVVLCRGLALGDGGGEQGQEQGTDNPEAAAEAHDPVLSQTGARSQKPAIGRGGSRR